MLHFLMSIILGAIAGGIAGKIMESRGGFLRNVLLGTVGGFVGQAVLSIFHLGATGWLGSVLVSIAGACLVIWLGRKLFH